MEPETVFSYLCAQADVELAEDSGFTKVNSTKKRQDPIISQAVLPNGKHIRLLKTLITSACERNCYYCPFRSGRDMRRETLSADEMAKIFIRLCAAGITDGIFLSSGIAGGSIRTQDQLIATAEILRRKYSYKGYVHLKLMPGAEYAQIEQAMRLSNRVSLNLEAPNPYRLGLLAPRKAFLDEIIRPLKWVQEIRNNHDPYDGWNHYWPSTSTQFVVGAVGESDRELLSTTENLYGAVGLTRAYYSAFRPVPGTPLEDTPAETPQREHRLYQASFLLRDYDFKLDELPFDSEGDLPKNKDPKTAWAELNLKNPVEINQAEWRDLLRVPGIGIKGARQIIQARKISKIHNLEDLRRIGVNPDRSTRFILLDGKPPAHQLRLF